MGKFTVVLGSAVLTAAAAGPVAAGNYGCFKVTAPQINIRAKPYSDAAIVGSASKGEILEKRKFFCTPRGYWCAVRKGGLDGYADKSLMEKISCP